MLLYWRVWSEMVMKLCTKTLFVLVLLCKFARFFARWSLKKIKQINENVGTTKLSPVYSKEHQIRAIWPAIRSSSFPPLVQKAQFHMIPLPKSHIKPFFSECNLIDSPTVPFFEANPTSLSAIAKLKWLILQKPGSRKVRPFYALMLQVQAAQTKLTALLTFVGSIIRWNRCFLFAHEMIYICSLSYIEN